MRKFRDYEVWKDGLSMAKNIYMLTKSFPKYDGLIGQMQRASVSIPSNIAEGASRTSENDFARFLEIALGSAYELETQIEVAREISYISDVQYCEYSQQVQMIEKKITNLITKIKK